MTPATAHPPAATPTGSAADRGRRVSRRRRAAAGRPARAPCPGARRDRRPRPGSRVPGAGRAPRPDRPGRSPRPSSRTPSGPRVIADIGAAMPSPVALSSASLRVHAEKKRVQAGQGAAARARPGSRRGGPSRPGRTAPAPVRRPARSVRRPPHRHPDEIPAMGEGEVRPARQGRLAVLLAAAAAAVEDQRGRRPPDQRGRAPAGSTRARRGSGPGPRCGGTGPAGPVRAGRAAPADRPPTPDRPARPTRPDRYLRPALGHRHMPGARPRCRRPVDAGRRHRSGSTRAAYRVDPTALGGSGSTDAEPRSAAGTASFPRALPRRAARFVGAGWSAGRGRWDG